MLARDRARSGKFWIPETIQASSMDCGPAALKSLLGGFDISVRYGRLREACQTQLDGTSIDTIEEVGRELGLAAEQVLIPLEHVLLAQAESLPALAVVALPGGATHFIAIWKRAAGRVQIMDPAAGRSWVRPTELIGRLFVLRFAVPAEGWRAFAGSADFARPLETRLRALGPEPLARRLLHSALGDPRWRSLAALDASARATAQLLQGGALSRSEAAALLERWYESSREPDASGPSIPQELWYARPYSGAHAQDGLLELRGTPLVRIRGRQPPAAASAHTPADATPADAAAPAPPARLSPELARALAEPEEPPLRPLWRALREEGLWSSGALALASGIAAGATLLEAMILRSQFDLARYLSDEWQRVAAALAALCFMLLLLALELPVAHAARRLGRGLEARLRIAFMRKVPRLQDRYFQSRLVSDMAERAHLAHALRSLPPFALAAVQGGLRLLATAAGMIWLDPASLPRVALASALALVLPLLLQRPLAERDLRVASHSGALSRFYFDALRGLMAIRAHGGEVNVCARHESLLAQWKESGYRLARAEVALDLAAAVLAAGLSGWLFLGYLNHAGEPGAALLFLYWAISLPGQGRELASLSQELPSMRSALLRLCEPLGALEARSAAASQPPPRAPSRAAPALQFRGVDVVAGGHSVLRDVDLAIGAGEHVAVVGHSGAGKSTLLGLLLGWHEPARGEIRVDAELLGPERLAALREECAWIDPGVQLWNHSLYENLRFGAQGGQLALDAPLEQAGLHGVLAALPDGLQTPLGEDGRRLSGGEGQRVRCGRALLRADARLALLDEPFRGLGRSQRRELLRRARAHWSGATLLCVTHDVGETLEFDRVIVIEDGRVCEVGPPHALRADADSRYSALLRAEQRIADALRPAHGWRALEIAGGELRELRAER